ncbi:DUF3888 domain-containing protein [Evansella tamaricis]|uniref:DUF3888 domain-containing protein n=1 Tax=Evansella tamaricis TaxID=2069301 RepID=A0ABS6JAQ6_9BACI|nr:DUF3888 domain-containing protein [Evansella tamaricis]MBU9710598.1 DUF3888 domain-containing protein [Evansella tamaricis]
MQTRRKYILIGIIVICFFIYVWHSEKTKMELQVELEQKGQWVNDSGILIMIHDMFSENIADAIRDEYGLGDRAPMGFSLDFRDIMVEPVDSDSVEEVNFHVKFRVTTHRGEENLGNDILEFSVNTFQGNEIKLIDYVRNGWDREEEEMR